ncbi:MAG: hypothetical protein A3F72_09450 [Bacteroidetes bacterium RIFCSPLOWO2_12_FULL_35_15]|nr:MAG: hypothetical protein A3F72_09450 [Bacteroidetes bacterium RIFCSPLOWO2_12_FULL_35_15]
MLIFTLFFTTCKKDEEADYIKKETIRGNVRNDCTGKGFANVEVKLLERHEKGHNNVEVTSYSYTTDTSGDFIFKDIDIHSSSKYSYAEFIESHYTPDYTFIGVGPLEIEKSHMSVFNQIGLNATFNICVLHLPPAAIIISPDTFTITLEQRIFHSYRPEMIYKLNWPSNLFPSPPNNYLNFGGHAMGLWHITFDKTKGGVHSVINDSIYLGMGDTAHYNIPW